MKTAKEMFEDLGFDKLEECSQENGMGKFIDMFNKDGKKTRKVVYNLPFDFHIIYILLVC